MAGLSLPRHAQATFTAIFALAMAFVAGCGAAASRHEAESPRSNVSVAAAITNDDDRGLPFPAHAYAAADPETCARHLYERHVPFTYVDSARGVNAPIRLTGPLHGVDFHGEPKSKRFTSVYEIIDCRLALALDDFAKLIARHDVVEVVHMSMYRPPPAHITDPTKRRSKHEAALAIDVGTLIKRDGTKLVIQHDWHGHIGAHSCGPDASRPDERTPEALELRDILCATVDAHLFQVVLTPNFDARHFNHFHLEVVRNVTWFLTR